MGPFGVSHHWQHRQTLGSHSAFSKVLFGSILGGTQRLDYVPDTDIPEYATALALERLLGQSLQEIVCISMLTAATTQRSKLHMSVHQST